MHCNQQALSLISERKIYVHVAQGQHILLEGTPALGIFFLYHGKAKLHKHGAGEKDIILKLARKGDMLGDCGIDRNQTYPFSATALEDSWCCFIENGIFSQLLKGPGSLAFAMLNYYTDELRAYEDRMLRLVRMNVRSKVADTLLLLRDVYGESSGRRSISVTLSRQELAEISGTTREQVSKTLSEFCQEKIIETALKEIIILQDKKLMELARI
ncbi:MAG: Crp/Fnr family transcriptional regulator [Bacteroidota bacterium]